MFVGTCIGGSSTALPSGRTPSSGCRPPTIAPQYTISVPSDDQTGFTDTPFVSLMALSPLAESLKRPGPLPSSPPITTHAPSGDQSGEPCAFSVVDSVRDSPPSADTI